MKIYQIINEVFTSNTFVISSDNSRYAYLVDIGDVKPVVDYLQHNGLELKALFFTHIHYDHIYGIHKIMDFFPNSIIYTSILGREAFASEKLNFSRYHNDPINFVSKNIAILFESDRIELYKNVYLDVFETPGHDNSCLCYKIDSCFFSGDSFIPGIKLIANLPSSNRVDAVNSKLRIMSLADKCNLYPGHGIVYENYESEK